MATTVTTHRFHDHPLQRIDPNIVYPDYSGQWKCDNCDQTYNSLNRPYHCVTCSYDLCESCYETKRHLHHEHPLYFAKMINIYPQYNGDWKCDGCGKTKRLQTDPNAYHCFHDQYDLCIDCFNGHRTKIHNHPLIPADAAIVYNNSPGLWICDICRRTGTNLMTKFSWHCSVCEFDCCNDCLQEVRIPEHVHPHPVKITDSFIVYPNYEGSWKCDMCGRDKTPDANDSNSSKPYHCDQCQFDACHECVHRILGRDPPLRQPMQHCPPRGLMSDSSSFDVTGPPATNSVRANESGSQSQRVRAAHEPPVEMYELEDDEANVENLDDSQKCIVCLSRPKNATIVHQRTGHVCCCLRCAYTLQQRGDRCPICRAQIDTVIKHYNS